MTKNSRFVSAAIALATLAGVSFATLPAQAAVICKTGGAIRGCIAATAPVIIRPAAPVAVTHAGVTRVTPNGVAHAGVTRVRR